MHRNLKDVRELTLCIPSMRVLQVKGAAKAKALRQKHAGCI